MGGRKAEEAGAERERKPDEVVVLSDPPVESFSMPPSSDFETITSPSLPASLPPKQLGTLVVAHRGSSLCIVLPRPIVRCRRAKCVGDRDLKHGATRVLSSTISALSDVLGGLYILVVECTANITTSVAGPLHTASSTRLGLHRSRVAIILRR